MPKSALTVEEEAWNAYPYTKTRYTCPFVEKFSLEIETYYFPDNGNQENVFGLGGNDLRNRVVGKFASCQSALTLSSVFPVKQTHRTYLYFVQHLLCFVCPQHTFLSINYYFRFLSQNTLARRNSIVIHFCYFIPKSNSLSHIASPPLLIPVKYPTCFAIFFLNWQPSNEFSTHGNP